jgi:hypothetical protein
MLFGSARTEWGLGLATEFSSEKNLRNRLRMAPVIPRKKALIPRFTEESMPRLGTEENSMKKKFLSKNPAPANRIDSMFSSETSFGTQFREFDLFFSLHGTEFRTFFSSAERFRTEFPEFPVPRNDSEQNSKSFLLFLFHGIELRAFSSSAE